MKIRWKPLLIQFAISLGVAGLSALSTMNSMGLYQSLNRPPLSPPGWLFGVVWTILFVLMGLSAYLVWITDSEDKKPGPAALWHPTGCEFCLVNSIFLPASLLVCFSMATFVVGADYRHDHRVHEGLIPSGNAPNPLSPLGDLCGVSQPICRPAQLNRFVCTAPKASWYKCVLGFLWRTIPHLLFHHSPAPLS